MKARIASRLFGLLCLAALIANSFLPLLHSAPGIDIGNCHLSQEDDGASVSTHPGAHSSHDCDACPLCQLRSAFRVADVPTRSALERTLAAHRVRLIDAPGVARFKVDGSATVPRAPPIPS